MKLLILLVALSLQAQTIAVKHRMVTAGAAATPTFSPASTAVANPTTVTISSVGSTSCDAYIYWGASNPPTTGDTHGTSITVTTAATYYAKVIGCPGYTDSAVGTGAYTITAATGLSAAHAYTITKSGGNAYVTPSFSVTAGQIVMLGIYGRVSTNECASFTAAGTDGTNTDTGTTFQSVNGSNPFVSTVGCGTSFLWTAPHASATYAITVAGTAGSYGTGLVTVQVFDPGSLAKTVDGTCKSTGGAPYTSGACSSALSPTGTVALIVPFVGYYDSVSSPAISGGCCGAIPAGATVNGASGTSSGSYLIANPVSGTYTPGFSGGAGDGVFVNAWVIK